MREYDRLAEMEKGRGERVMDAARRINEIKNGFIGEQARIYRETPDRRTAAAEVNLCRRKAREDLQRIADVAMPLVEGDRGLSDELYYAVRDVEHFGQLEQYARRYAERCVAE